MAMDNIKIESLEDLRKIKAEKKAIADEKANLIAKKTKDIFAPVPSRDKLSALMGTVNNGLAIFDGFMLGMKVIRRIKSAFRNN